MGLRLRALVVEDSLAIARQVASVLREQMEVTVAATLRAALAYVERGDFDLLVIDVCLPDGSGFDIVAPARARQPQVAALLITGDSSLHTNHRAFELGVQVLRKPFGRAPINELVERVAKQRCPAVHDLRLHVRAFAHRFGLSEREAEVVGLLAQGHPRGRIASELKVQETTVKTLLTRVRRKVGVDSPGELISGIWGCEVATSEIEQRT